MIRQIKSLYTKTLARIVPPMGRNEKELDAKTIVQRRVEITVERESVSVLQRGQPTNSAQPTAVDPGHLNAQAPELPPWPDTPKRQMR